MTKSYSTDIKEMALKKVYERKDKTIAQIAIEQNIKLATLKGWLQTSKRNAKLSALPTAKRPEDWTVEARLLALQQSHGLSNEALSSWCRQQGLFPHTLEQWRTAFCQLSPDNGRHTAQEIKQLKQTNHHLEKELLRKEKALAEAAALLILQKKLQALWGEEAK